MGGDLPAELVARIPRIESACYLVQLLAREFLRPQEKERQQMGFVEGCAEQFQCRFGVFSGFLGHRTQSFDRDTQRVFRTDAEASHPFPGHRVGHRLQAYEQGFGASGGRLCGQRFSSSFHRSAVFFVEKPQAWPVYFFTASKGKPRRRA